MQIVLLYLRVLQRGYVTKGSKVFYIQKGSEQEQSLVYNRIEELFTKGEIIGEAYENLNVDRVEYIEDIIRVFVSWEIPFRLGDKITIYMVQKVLLV